MKTSQLIAELSDIITRFGDVEIITGTTEGGYLMELTSGPHLRPITFSLGQTIGNFGNEDLGLGKGPGKKLFKLLITVD